MSGPFAVQYPLPANFDRRFVNRRIGQGQVRSQTERGACGPDWHGAWDEYPCILSGEPLDQGSGRRQARWFGNLVISTQPIGPIRTTKPAIFIWAAPQT